MLLNADNVKVLVTLKQDQLQALANAVDRLRQAMEKAKALVQWWIGPNKVSWATHFVRNKLDLEDIKDVSPPAWK